MGEAPFLTAAWRHLVLLSYQIDPAILLPLIPQGTALDTWEDQALVSIVGFRFLETRILGLPVPFHVNFDEVNLRFYVRRHAEGAWRHGVVFIREVVARRAIATVARMMYNEPYVTLPTRHQVNMGQAQSGGTGIVRYQWRQGRWYSLEATTEGIGEPIRPGSHPEFITHREWGYTRQKDGGTIEYHVSHPRWSVWNASTWKLDCDVARMYGSLFVPALQSSPVSALVADGSEVVVARGRRV
jgi:uncharacterized protein YqjF (DUF2071 family)